jgi:SAM-dependent methyltransferase
MRIDVHAESMLERLALATGQVPIPIAHGLGAALLARSLMAATRLGVFEALQARPLTATEVSAACSGDLDASAKLLDALVASAYLTRRGSHYDLTSMSRKWLLKGSPTSLHDAILYQATEWDWLRRLDEFVRTGRPLDFHAIMTRNEWGLYQRAMRAIAGIAADELARRLPLPKGARAMLDVGGSHGYYAVALCRRYPALHATVLDLPQAIEHAAPMLARENMGNRVVHRAGDARVDDLGAAAYDLVLVAQLLHHFDQAAGSALVAAAARALRPGGCLVILEAIPSGRCGQFGGLLDLYFAFTSRACLWSLEQLADCQRRAGLAPRRRIRLRTLPHSAAQAAFKPTHGGVP